MLWTGFGHFSVQGLTFLTAVILARFLTPEDFGLVGMVLVLNAFLVIFANAGLKTTIVQNQNFKGAEHQAMLGLACCTGVVVGALFVILAPLVVWFFGEPRLMKMCFALAPAVLLTALAQVPMGVLEKEMAFRLRAACQFLSVLVASGIAVWMAVRGFGYWALIWQILLRNILLFVSLTLAAKTGCMPQIDISLYKRIFHYTGNLTGFQVINYFSRNLDNILIGKFLGLVSLGLYTRAYSLMSIFRQTLGAVLIPVMHSAMATKQNDCVAIKKAYLEITVAVLWLTGPITGFCAAFSDRLIVIVWGSQYTNAGPVFMWLAVAGIHQGLTSTTGTVFAVRNKTKELLVVGLINTTIILIAIIIGLIWGIVGVAFSYSLACWILFFPLMAYVSSQLLNYSIIRYFKLVIPILIVSFMPLIARLSFDYMEIENAQMMTLVVGLIVVLCFFPKDAKYFWRLIKNG